MLRNILVCAMMIVFLSACGKKEEIKPVNNNLPVENLPPANTDLPLDSTDYTVISSAISQYLYPPVEFKGRAEFFTTPGSAPNLSAEIVILDSTKFNPPQKSVLDKHRRIDPSDSTWAYWLSAVNQTGYSIDSTRIFSELVVKVRSAGYLKENKNAVNKIYSSFPNGVIYVSKPAYSNDKKRALVYFRVSGKTGDKEGLIWLHAGKPVWNMYDIVKY